MLLLASYCRDTPEAKDLSAEGLGIAVERHGVLCIVTRNTTISGAMGNERSVRDAKMGRSGVLKISRNNTESIEGGTVAQEEERASTKV